MSVLDLVAQTHSCITNVYKYQLDALAIWARAQAPVSLIRAVRCRGGWPARGDVGVRSGAYLNRQAAQARRAAGLIKRRGSTGRGLGAFGSASSFWVRAESEAAHMHGQGPAPRDMGPGSQSPRGACGGRCRWQVGARYRALRLALPPARATVLACTCARAAR